VKRLLFALLVAVILAGPVAAGDKVNLVWTAQATNTTATIDTTGYKSAQVTIWAAEGSPDGTVSIYYDSDRGGPLVLLKQYATPTTVKTFAGPVGTKLVVGLSGMSTGKVGCTVVLK
jgi:hypothetical protein